MAMYFVGANYDGENMVDQFIEAGGFFIGYTEIEAQPLYKLMGEIGIGDFIILKAYSPSKGLYIKAIGYCIDHKMIYHPELNHGKKVEWLWQGNEHFGTFKDYYTHMRTGSIYIERNDLILERVIALVSKHLEQ